MSLIENFLKVGVARTGFLARILSVETRKQLVADLAPKYKNGSIELGGGARIEYPLNDYYWLSLASNIRQYESEIWYLADRFFDQDTIFIDAGANIGLWSSYAAAKIRNPAQVIAVEPGHNALSMLRHNHEIGGRKFTLVEKAIWFDSDQKLEFAVCNNSVSNYLVTAGGYSSQTIRPNIVSILTTCIDDIADKAFNKAPNSSRIIIKLDVEGAEIAAIKGAKKTLEQYNALIIFEDHRKDKSCKITAEILDELGLHVYRIDPETFACKQISQAKELLPYKTNSLHGCNFVACRPGSEFDMEFQEMCRQSEKNLELSWVRFLAKKSMPPNFPDF